jgi:hypothetical protein
MRDIRPPELLEVQRANVRATVDRFRRAFDGMPVVQTVLSSLGRALAGEPGEVAPEDLAALVARAEAQREGDADRVRRAVAVERGIKAGQMLLAHERTNDKARAAMAAMVREFGAGLEVMAAARGSFVCDMRGRVCVIDSRGAVLSGYADSGLCIWHPDAATAVRACAARGGK